MNPFELKPLSLTKCLENWKELYRKPFCKYDVSPYTKTRIILLNGAEFEAVSFSHRFSRSCNNNDIRRELAFSRRIEQQQQKILQSLKPIDQNILEETITYEQLAVDLTARLAQMEPDVYVKAALDFALLEDFDHLYRYSNLLDMEYGILPEKLVGRYTEIMPARPTIAHHRHPFDTIRNFTNKDAAAITKLNINIITAAEQQTMNYYMNVGGFYTSDEGRKLYQEIGMVEEDHVTHYGSLLDPNTTWLENLLLHEYTECYLYYSCMCDESDKYIQKIWEQFFEYEVAQLHVAKNLLEQYENKQWNEVIPNGEFPELLKLGPNIEYVRDILANTVNYTTTCENYICVNNLPKDALFFKYQDIVNNDVCNVPSHVTIEDRIKKCGIDYRYEISPNPIKSLQNRCCDNTCLGRIPME